MDARRVALSTQRALMAAPFVAESMQSENAIHRFDLGRFDEAGMRDRHRIQGTFERFLPELQKTPQFREIWAEVIVLPDVGLQQPRMVRAPIQDVRGG